MVEWRGEDMSLEGSGGLPLNTGSDLSDVRLPGAGGARPTSIPANHGLEIVHPQLVTAPLFEGGEVSFFQGKTRDYIVEVHRSGSNGKGFLDVPQYAAMGEAVEDKYLDVYPTRNPDRALARVRKSLSYPRTMLMLISHEGKLVGYGVFSRLAFGTSSELVMTSSRALKDEGEGLGSMMLDKAVKLHNAELVRSHRWIRWIELVTQNPVSEFTLEKLAIVKDTYPIGKPTVVAGEADPTMERPRNFYNRHPAAQLVMVRCANLEFQFWDSTGMDYITGVSKSELSGLGMNEATARPSEYRPNTRLQQIYQMFVRSYPDGLDINRERGDGLHITAEIVRPPFRDDNRSSLPEAA